MGRCAKILCVRVSSFNTLKNRKLGLRRFQSESDIEFNHNVLFPIQASILIIYADRIFFSSTSIGTRFFSITDFSKLSKHFLTLFREKILKISSALSLKNFA